jgi:hypothetical protein
MWYIKAKLCILQFSFHPYLFIEIFLLTCIYCTRGFHCGISLHAHNAIKFAPCFTLSYPFSLLKIILMGLIFLFSHMHMKYLAFTFSFGPLSSPCFTITLYTRLDYILV